MSGAGYADRRQPFRCQRMREPHGQGPGLEHHPSGPRCAAADHLGDEPRIGAALAAPDPLAVAAIDTAVSFIDTSRPTYSAIFILRSPAPKPARSRDGLATPSWIGRAAVGSTPAPTLSER